MMTETAPVMSFSANAKAELCKDVPSRHCCAVAQAFGILLYCNTFSAESVRIVTESREFAWHLPPAVPEGLFHGI